MSFSAVSLLLSRALAQQRGPPQYVLLSVRVHTQPERRRSRKPSCPPASSCRLMRVLSGHGEKTRNKNNISKTSVLGQRFTAAFGRRVFPQAPAFSTAPLGARSGLRLLRLLSLESRLRPSGLEKPLLHGRPASPATISLLKCTDPRSGQIAEPRHARGLAAARGSGSGRKRPSLTGSGGSVPS